MVIRLSRFFVHVLVDSTKWEKEQDEVSRKRGNERSR